MGHAVANHPLAEETHIRSFKAASSLPNFRHSFITEAEGLQLPS